MKKLLLLLLLPLFTYAQKECVVNINTDQYPSETSWQIYDNAENILETRIYKTIQELKVLEKGQ
mgnify:CR=1 FL=1